MSSDEFCCRIDRIRHRTARRLGPEARPDVVGAAPKQQIEPLPLRGHHRVPPSGAPIRPGPVAVGEIVIIRGVLDHAIERDVFHDFELSHGRYLICAPRPPAAGEAGDGVLESSATYHSPKRARYGCAEPLD